MEHPSYASDLAPNGLWLFPEIKSALKGWKFQGIEDIQKERRDDHEFEYARGCEFFSSPPPDRFWGRPSLLSNGYQRFFPWE
jgi:hypothetical protein